MSQIQDQLEGLPGYDIVMDYYNEYAEEHFNKVNPYEDKDGNKLKLGPNNSDRERKIWKKVQLKAWVHDKCFMGSCGVGMDCGLGLAPLVVLLLPGLGPILMYAVHARLIHIVTNEMKLPNKLIAQLESQILFDLIITFPPLIGSFFGWLHGCLTRNAGAIYKYLDYIGEQRAKNVLAAYVGTRQPVYQPKALTQAQAQAQPRMIQSKKEKGRKVAAPPAQQESGFI